ncbi:MAG: HD domain-containing protein [bacterium]|jgi:uncharacterized protein
MPHEKLIDKTVHFVKNTLSDAEGGHDWWHTYRVWKMARHIAEAEGVVNIVIDLGALLHDIADAKFHGGDESKGPVVADNFLMSLGIDAEIREHVIQIIRNISFKNASEQHFRSPELDIIQDADRLDAMGAIGIARAFNYGGFKNRPMYDPLVKPDLHMSKEKYKKGLSPTLNHFHEKLLLLKEMMNTPAGKALAKERHEYMIAFVSRFLEEWEGKM